ncbi:response regulator transcription factor [Clostridium sp. YIM B02515]|uniref:Stage 0 sporulation protein A homolog n=1 Tax=Clostridium rhizosphaerae TaxID=2803861 RepID=A0ABS1TDZ7_9CLOT|nr:response regulator transcription factor [Clostridium rhizosphaerae]MBL4937592.1 response regulator transcription factor [Clostridium rhizosphaerae]
MDNIKILLIEDDEAVALGIDYNLRNEGFEVIRAGDLLSAKQLFSDEFQLILLDIGLPDGNGYEFCKYIRENSMIPIIFLTALDEEVNVVLGFDLGGDDYITKPFRIKELLSRIKAVLRRTSNSQKTRLISGNIEVNSLAAKVYKNKKDIILTAVEYKLLLYFMGYPYKVISKEEILHRLWDIQGDFVDENTAAVYVRRLREKLEDEPSNPSYLITVRGLGYKWDKNVIEE